MNQNVSKIMKNYRNKKNTRKLLIQAIYQWDWKKNTHQSIQRQYMSHSMMQDADAAFFQKGFDVITHLYPIFDQFLQEFSPHAIDRLPLSIMRVAIYELLYSQEPRNIILNEAIELSKYFGGVPSYVNAVLDSFCKKKKLAFLFPGQGSQALNMLSTFKNETNKKIIHQVFEQASAVLGEDIEQLSKKSESIHQTKWTQILMLTVSYALWQCWLEEKGRKPDFLAGHSLGEYTALCCSGAIDFSTALQLVSIRGSCMEQLSPSNSGMAVIVGLPYIKVEELCTRINQSLGKEEVIIANYNTEMQIVIAGMRPALQKLLDISQQFQPRLARFISVSVPAHSPWMAPVSEKLQQEVYSFHYTVPKYFIISDHRFDMPENIPSSMVQQVVSPVNWVRTVQRLQNIGVDHAIECGHGRVLCGLSKPINSMTISTEEDFYSALQKF